MFKAPIAGFCREEDHPKKNCSREHDRLPSFNAEERTDLIIAECTGDDRAAVIPS
jgi:hypothetical protein